MGNRLDQIRERLEKATKGPWRSYSTLQYEGVCADRGDDDRTEYALLRAVRSQRNPLAVENTDLIAHAPTDLRDLLAVAEAAHRYVAAHSDAETFAPNPDYTPASHALDAALAPLLMEVPSAE